MNERDRQQVIASVFMRESVRLTGMLTRLLGPQNVELAEDVVQEAFLAASKRWSVTGVPQNPAGWLMRTARNRAIDAIRRERKRRHFPEDVASLLGEEAARSSFDNYALDEDPLHDDTLTMIFLCCGIDVSADQRITLILKSLCGMRVSAIARALLTTEATVKKRLVRVRRHVRGKSFALPAHEDVPHALRTVHMALYLLFNEGYLSTSGDPIQHDVCRHAMFLTRHLTDAADYSDASTHALLALMCFHAARYVSRMGDDGALIPIDQQDRASWDRALLVAGFNSLQRARNMDSGHSTRYMLEAAIAAQHCAARSFEETNWTMVCRLYDRLMHVQGSPITALNRAVAMSYRDGPAEAIKLVSSIRAASKNGYNGRADAVLAHLYARLGDGTNAERHLAAALSETNAEHERNLLKRQIARALSTTTS